MQCLNLRAGIARSVLTFRRCELSFVSATNVYSIITEQIIKQLENGVVPWRKPWTTDYPKSLRSLKEYRGLNVLMLASQGYASPYWLTFNQAKQLGGHVKQGEHSSIVTFWKKSPYTKRNANTGDDETRMGFLLRYYRVFNLCQTEGIAEKLGLSLTGSESANVVPDIEACERIVRSMRNAPKIEDSSAAWYRPLTDTVGIPPKSRFVGSPEYYSTLFHELGHSTGHKSRLDRECFGNPIHFGSESYSKEELVAEFTAAFLCGHAEIAPSVIENSAAYLRGWLSRLRSDSKLLVSAASHAQKACDYIMGTTFEESADSVPQTENESEAIAA
jgi:antirestriction protein ArdC